MRAGHTLIIGVLALALAACQPAGSAATDAGADAPVEARDAAAVDGSGLAAAEAQREGFILYVDQNTDDCELPEGRERATELVDLGGGVGAVIVQCSMGMRDTWNQLFIAYPGDELGHPMAVPLTRYDIQGDGEWRAEFASPNLTWDSDRREFVSSIAQAATGCGTSTRWRWDGEAQRVAMVEQTTMDCDGLGPDEPRPEPRVVWPTDPATPEPGTT